MSLHIAHMSFAYMHAPLSYRTSLLKHKFKDVIIKTINISIAEHSTNCRVFSVQVLVTAQLHAQEPCPRPTSLLSPALALSCIPSCILQPKHANYTHPLQMVMCWPSTLLSKDPGKRLMQALKAGFRLQSAKLPASSGLGHMGIYTKSHNLFTLRGRSEWDPPKAQGPQQGLHLWGS